MKTLERVAAVIAADADGISVAQTLGAAGPVALDGVAVKADDGSAAYDIGYVILDPPRRIIIDSVGNDSAVNFTIVGTDRVGKLISEILPGGNAGPVTSVYVYSRIISVTADDATAADITIGWGTESLTGWLIVSRFRDWRTRVFFPSGGTVNYDVEVTSDNVMRREGDYADDVRQVLAAQAGNIDSVNDAPYSAIRVRMNSGDQPITLRVLPSTQYR